MTNEKPFVSPDPNKTTTKKTDMKKMLCTMGKEWRYFAEIIQNQSHVERSAPCGLTPFSLIEG